MSGVTRPLVRSTAFVRKEAAEVVRQPRLLLVLIVGPFAILPAALGLRGAVVPQAPRERQQHGHGVIGDRRGVDGPHVRQHDPVVLDQALVGHEPVHAGGHVDPAAEPRALYQILFSRA